MHTQHQQSAMHEREREEMVVGVWEGNIDQLGAWWCTCKSMQHRANERNEGWREDNHGGGNCKMMARPCWRRQATADIACGQDEQRGCLVNERWKAFATVALFYNYWTSPLHKLFPASHTMMSKMSKVQAAQCNRNSQYNSNNDTIRCHLDIQQGPTRATGDNNAVRSVWWRSWCKKVEGFSLSVCAYARKMNHTILWMCIWFNPNQVTAAVSSLHFESYPATFCVPSEGQTTE